MTVKFEDYSMKVKAKLDDATIAFLHEAAGELKSQAQRNQTRVDTGKTKGAWDYKVDEGAGVATIGNPLENAIWEEFGTGEYALNGDGRKGGWKYEDSNGNWQFTRGKKPLRGFWKAYTSSKTKIIKRAEQVIGGKMK